MPIEIRQTIVQPSPSGDIVQLHISDAPPDAESASFVLRILAKLPASQGPLVAQMQRAAMRLAQDAMTPILQNLAREIQAAGKPLDLQPRPRPPEPDPADYEPIEDH